jgi:hypothetical protein
MHSCIIEGTYNFCLNLATYIKTTRKNRQIELRHTEIDNYTRNHPIELFHVRHQGDKSFATFHITSLADKNG